MAKLLRVQMAQARFRTRALRGALAAVLTSALPAAAQSLTWDSGGISPTNPVDGGGTWDTTSPDWSNGAADTMWSNNDTAIFGNANGTAGTLTLAGGISAAGLTFNPAGAGNYTIAGTSPLTLTGTAPTINVNGTQATISAPIAGVSGLRIVETTNGMLTLRGSNTFSGGTDIIGGTLIAGSNSALGTDGAYIMSGTTLAVNSPAVSARYLENDGTISIPSGDSLNVSGGYNHSGSLVVNGSFSLNSGYFLDYSGTISGNPIFLKGNSRLIIESPVNTGTFDFIGSGTQNLVAQSIPAGITVNQQPTVGTSTLTSDSISNSGTLSLLAPIGGSVNFNSSGSFTNNGTVNIAAAGSVLATPSFAAGFGIINASAGKFHVNTSLNIVSYFENFGSLTIATGQTLGFDPNGGVFYESGGTTTVGAGGSLKLGSINGFSGQLQISGGNISLAAGTTPASLSTALVTWPNPTTAQNPATDMASITTTAVGTRQLPGQINLQTAEATFNIADPNATLTVSADITGGSLDKTGPGTLVLNGTLDINGTLKAMAGTLTVGPTASLGVSGTTISTGATVNIEPATSGIHAVSFLGLSIVGGLGLVAAPTIHNNRTFLTLSSLSFGPSTYNWQGQLDLTSNDVDVQNGSLATITNEIKTGCAGGAWTGKGIVSSAAGADPSHLTTLGVILNDDGTGHPLYGFGTPLGLFDGQSPAVFDVLIKYTYSGDANLDGGVDGSDYTKIDVGFNSQSGPQPMTGWANGDFNYDGTIDGSDYTLIDNAFNTQGPSLGSNPLALVAYSTARIAAGSSSVPEPASVGLIVAAGLGALARRRLRK